MVLAGYNFPTLTALPPAWRRSSFASIAFVWLDSFEPLYDSTHCRLRKIPDLGSIHASVIEAKVNLADYEIEVYQTGFFSELVAFAIKRVVELSSLVMAPLGCIWHAGSCVYYVTIIGKNIVLGKDETRPIHLKQHMCSCLQDLIATVSFCALVYMHLNSKSSLLNKALTQKLNAIECCMSFFMLITPAWANCTLHVLTSSREPFELKRHFGLVGEGGWLLFSESTVDKPSSFNLCTGLSKNSPLHTYCRFSLLSQNADAILHQCSNAVDLLQLRLEEDDIQEFTHNPKRFLYYLESVLENVDSPIPCNRDDLQRIKDQITLLFDRHNNMQEFLDHLEHSHNKSMSQSLPLEHWQQPFRRCWIQASYCRRFFARETNIIRRIPVTGEGPRTWEETFLLNHSTWRSAQAQPLTQEALGSMVWENPLLNNTMRNTPRPPEPLLILDLDLELAEFLPKPPPPSWGG